MKRASKTKKKKMKDKFLSVLWVDIISVFDAFF